MKRRAHRVLFLGAAFLIAGLAYAALCRQIGHGIPCLFHTVTGRQCPGCGVSRMCIRLLCGDIPGAFSANGALLLLLPLLAAVLWDATARYIREGTWRTKGWSTVAVWVMIAVLLAFGVWRNL